MADYSSIIDEFRHTAGRLALKHKEEKAKRLKKKPPEAEKIEEQEEPADEELDETAAEEEQEEEGEQEEPQEDDLTHVIRRATRHARVVAHRGHGEKRPSAPPDIRPTARDAAHKMGMPPATAKAQMLKPRIVGPKR